MFGLVRLAHRRDTGRGVAVKTFKLDRTTRHSFNTSTFNSIIYVYIYIYTYVYSNNHYYDYYYDYRPSG